MEPKPFLSRPGPYLIAHRGGSALAPENTLPAFDAAVRLGADVLELDVHLTRDGEVVVFHDPTTERITGVPGTVAGRTAAELEALDAGWAFTADGGRSHPWRGRGIRAPRLAEVLERYPGTLLNVEAKDPGPALAEALTRLVQDFGRVHSVCLGSSDEAQGERLRRLLSEACHFMPEAAARRHVMAARGAGDAAACPGGWDVADLPAHLEDGTPLLDREVVDWFRSRGIPVHAWTVDEEEEMRALLGLGVAGIMSDRPDVLRRVLGRG